ncbi:hypothetical protein [Helicovermis profundi]|uniref:Uncharacterized protein n=1 Tax=Helicovermis profundi TaxID=3065157 RepID=A0AAU9EC64_9FIRM|nr:hypothetical protein HLPR_27730 [Clostridia bacterium S502]
MLLKVSEVAKRLLVDKISIIEVLIINKDELKEYIEKKSGVTYIREEGVKVISSIINGTYLEDTQSTIINDMNLNVHVNEVALEIDDSIDENIKIEEDYFRKIEEVSSLNESVNLLKTKLLNLDSILIRKNDAIMNYRNILLDDVQWISMLEEKLDYKFSNSGLDFTEGRSRGKLLDKLFVKNK